MNDVDVNPGRFLSKIDSSTDMQSVMNEKDVHIKICNALRTRKEADDESNTEKRRE